LILQSWIPYFFVWAYPNPMYFCLWLCLKRKIETKLKSRFRDVNAVTLIMQKTKKDDPAATSLVNNFHFIKGPQVPKRMRVRLPWAAEKPIQVDIWALWMQFSDRIQPNNPNWNRNRVDFDRPSIM